MSPDSKEALKPTSAPEPPQAGPVVRVERFAGRLGAVAGGVALMIAGIGLGVTVVLLPVGVVVGLLGLFLFLYGVCAPGFRKDRD